MVTTMVKCCPVQICLLSRPIVANPKIRALHPIAHCSLMNRCIESPVIISLDFLPVELANEPSWQRIGQPNQCSTSFSSFGTQLGDSHESTGCTHCCKSCYCSPPTRSDRSLLSTSWKTDLIRNRCDYSTTAALTYFPLAMFLPRYSQVKRGGWGAVVS